MRIFLAASMVLISIFFSACDECQNVNCINGGVCNSGQCDCLAGFSGNACQIEDECITKAISCENGKECVSGVCDCGTWYNGAGCETKVVDDYVGPYIGIFGCSNDNGSVAFSSSSSENELKITEYTGRVYNAVFLTENTFEIPIQTLPEEFGFGPLNVSGSGSINATSGSLQFSITYNYPNQGSSTVCVFTGN